VRERRKARHRSWADIPVENLVFLGERAASTALARRYGRSRHAREAERLRPAGHWLTVTLLSAVRVDGPLAPFLIDGAVDGPVFSAWVEQSLLRELRPGDVVIMDNLSTHRIADVSRLLGENGHEFFYLPPYSPDFNPIENMWSKVKSILRRLEARTYEELLEAMKTAILSVTEDDCMGFFKHCGYGVNH